MCPGDSSCFLICFRLREMPLDDRVPARVLFKRDEGRVGRRQFHFPREEPGTRYHRACRPNKSPFIPRIISSEIKFSEAKEG